MRMRTDSITTDARMGDGASAAERVHHLIVREHGENVARPTKA
jgi:hypothetical protein